MGNAVMRLRRKMQPTTFEVMHAIKCAEELMDEHKEVSYASCEWDGTTQKMHLELAVCPKDLRVGVPAIPSVYKGHEVRLSYGEFAKLF